MVKNRKKYEDKTSVTFGFLKLSTNRTTPAPKSGMGDPKKVFFFLFFLFFLHRRFN